MRKVEETDDYIHVPVRSASDFVQDSFRTIDISKDQGIKAVIGKLKSDPDGPTHIQKYLFAKSEGWTVDSATEWVEEHKESKTMSIQALFEKTREKTASTIRYKGYPMREKLRNDAGELLVPGFFTDDQEDAMGDIITQAATDKAVDRWRMWGNIRTMHEYPSGKVVKIGAGDGLGWNELITRPVESKTIELLEGGVLQAYSVGIIPLEYEINEEALPEDEDDWTFWQWLFPPIIIHDYDMVEISYVDIPANPRAVFAEIEMEENAMELLTNRVFAPRGQSATVFKALGESPLYKSLEAESTKEEKDMSKELKLQEPAVEEELEPVVEEEEIAEEETPDPLHELMLGLTDAVNNLTETLGKRFDDIELMLAPEVAEEIPTVEEEPVEDSPVHTQKVIEDEEPVIEAKGLTAEDVKGMIGKAVSESEERVTKVIGDKLAELAKPTERRAILEPEPPDDEVEEDEVDVRSLNRQERKRRLKDILEERFPNR